MSTFNIVNAAGRNQIKFLEELLAEGADVNEMQEGVSALHAACANQARESVEILLRANINVDLQDAEKGQTALHYCAVYNYLELAKMILATGAKQNVADNFGNQPLWAAVFGVKGKSERLAMVELLLQQGADKNHKNNSGKCPLELAETFKNEVLVEMLGRY